MKRSKKLVFSDEAIKQLGMTKKEFVAQVGKHAYEPQWAKAKQNVPDLPDFPQCSDYGNITDLAILGDTIESYRLSFFSPDFRQKNVAHYKAAFDAVREMQTNHPALCGVDVPLADNLDEPTEKDFILLAQCCTKFSAVLNANANESNISVTKELAAETLLATRESIREKALTDVPTLTEDQLKVLNHLNDRYPQIETEESTADATGISRKTVRLYLTTLKQQRLASLPKGKKKGCVITERGRDYITDNFS